MRAIDLIPADAGRGAAGRAGGAAYVVLGLLAVLVAGVAYFVVTNNAVAERRAELDSLRAQVRATQAQAAALRPYREFAALADARVKTVRQLGSARFDWHRAFEDLSRALPEDVWLTSLLGTVTTGVNVSGAGSSGTGSLRTALPVPAIEMTGCTTSQVGVARVISRLRLVTGVQRVALADSSKVEEGGGGGGATGGADVDCRYGNGSFPQFNVVVFFGELPAVEAPDAGAAPGASAAAATQPAAATETAPPPSGEGAGDAGGSDLR